MTPDEKNGSTSLTILSLSKDSLRGQITYED